MLRLADARGSKGGSVRDLRRASVHATESTRIVFSVSHLFSLRYRGLVHETRTVERGGEI
jgi:hypothetical protein